jgi:hypothetical protein
LRSPKKDRATITTYTKKTIRTFFTSAGRYLGSLFLFFRFIFLPLIQFSSPFQVSKGDFVLVEYASKKSARTVEYVGEVREILARNKFSVSFLKQYMN